MAAKRGRPPFAVPKVEWAVMIPQPLAAQVELLLLDPLLDKPKHGARSELLEQLLREWLEKQKGGTTA